MRHTLKQHGNAESEKSRGQIAVTESDFKRLPEIVNTPDYVIYGSKKDIQNNTIVYAKNNDDGSTLFVEEVRKEKKTLAADTMFKLSDTSDARSLARNPTFYARNDTSTIKIVDVKREIVNGAGSDFLPADASPDDTGTLYQQEADIIAEAADA